MNSHEEYKRRLDLASKYLEEAEKAFGLKFWRISCASAQAAAENAAKAVYALYRAVPKVHDMCDPVLELTKWGLVSEEEELHAEQLARLCELLGAKEHIIISYGDEAGGKTPWQLADKGRASRSLSWAREAVALANAWKK